MLGRVISDFWRSLFHRQQVPADTPAGVPALVEAARAAVRAGDRDLASGYCERALQMDPEATQARDLLMEMYLHGRYYDDVIADIHRHLRPRTFIEIGVDSGASLRLVLPETLVLGVDPNPAIRFELPPNVRIFRETSDHFFAAHDLRAELGGLPLDLAFIDGMHQFEFALRDFINLERLCGRHSTILLHDCFAIDGQSSRRERKSSFWSGDIWRLVVLLKKYRPDLRVHTIAAAPSGLAMVRNLDPGSRFLSDNLERLCDEFLRLDYGYLRRDRAAKLNLIPNDWDGIRRLLDEAPLRS